jgi:hypothetical protein
MSRTLEQEIDEEAVDIMVLLLTEGLPDDASRRCGVVWMYITVL